MRANHVETAVHSRILAVILDSIMLLSRSVLHLVSSFFTCYPIAIFG